MAEKKPKPPTVAELSKQIANLVDRLDIIDHERRRAQSAEASAKSPPQIPPFGHRRDGHADFYADGVATCLSSDGVFGVAFNLLENGGNNVERVATARIPASTAKVLAKALGDAVRAYEQVHGAIPTNWPSSSLSVEQIAANLRAPTADHKPL